MRFFRVRLILALIASVTLVSVASTYFDVLAHRHVLREDLERRTKWMDRSIQPDIQNALAAGDHSSLPNLADSLKSATGALALALYDQHGNLMASSGPPDVITALTRNIVDKSLQKGIDVDAFGHARQWQWLEEASPIHNGNDLEGAMALSSMRATSALRAWNFGSGASGASLRWLSSLWASRWVWCGGSLCGP